MQETQNIPRIQPAAETTSTQDSEKKKKKKKKKILASPAPTDINTNAPKEEKENTEEETIRTFVQDIVEVIEETKTLWSPPTTFSTDYTLPPWLHELIIALDVMRGNNKEKPDSLLDTLIQNKFKKADSPLPSPVKKKIHALLLSLFSLPIVKESLSEHFVDTLRTNNPEKIKTYIEKYHLISSKGLTAKEIKAIDAFDKEHFSPIATQIEKVLETPFITPIFYDPYKPPQKTAQNKECDILIEMLCAHEKFCAAQSEEIDKLLAALSQIEKKSENAFREIRERQKTQGSTLHYDAVLENRRIRLTLKQFQHKVYRLHCALDLIFIGLIDGRVSTQDLEYESTVLYLFDTIRDSLGFFISLTEQCENKANNTEAEKAWKRKAAGDLAACITRLRKGIYACPIDKTRLDQNETVITLDRLLERLGVVSPKCIQQSVPAILPECIQNITALPSTSRAKAQKNKSKKAQEPTFYDRVQKTLLSVSQLNAETAGALPLDQREIDTTIRTLLRVLNTYEKKNPSAENPAAQRTHANLLQVVSFFIGFCLRTGKHTAKTANYDADIYLEEIYWSCIEKRIQIIRLISEKTDAQTLSDESMCAWIQTYMERGQQLEQQARELDVEQQIARQNSLLPEKPIRAITYDAALVREELLQKYAAHMAKKEFAAAKEKCAELNEVTQNDTLEILYTHYAHIELFLNILKSLLKEPPHASPKKPLDTEWLTALTNPFLKMLDHQKRALSLLDAYVADSLKKQDKQSVAEDEKIQCAIRNAKILSEEINRTTEWMSLAKNTYMVRLETLERGHLEAKKRLGPAWYNNPRTERSYFSLEYEKTKEGVHLWKDIELEAKIAEIAQLEEVLRTIADTAGAKKILEELEVLKKKIKKHRQKNKNEAHQTTSIPHALSGNPAFFQLPASIPFLSEEILSSFLPEKQLLFIKIFLEDPQTDPKKACLMLRGGAALQILDAIIYGKHSLIHDWDYVTGTAQKLVCSTSYPFFFSQHLEKNPHITELSTGRFNDENTVIAVKTCPGLTCPLDAASSKKCAAHLIDYIDFTAHGLCLAFTKKGAFWFDAIIGKPLNKPEAYSHWEDIEERRVEPMHSDYLRIEHDPIRILRVLNMLWRKEFYVFDPFTQWIKNNGNRLLMQVMDGFLGPKERTHVIHFFGAMKTKAKELLATEEGLEEIVRELELGSSIARIQQALAVEFPSIIKKEEAAVPQATCM